MAKVKVIHRERKPATQEDQDYARFKESLRILRGLKEKTKEEAS